MPKDDHASSLHHSPPVSVGRSAVIWIGRLAVGLVGLAVAGGAALLLAVAIALAVAYPNLPDVADLADYRPKLPLRVLTADGQLIGEFGEER
ncbi:MAG: penicillin-binding protein, partial [Hydrogenophaga sp.]|nr:penicillin-binding protein [Hydrogenophaga sp.]